jgi:hypothetical protein
MKAFQEGFRGEYKLTTCEIYIMKAFWECMAPTCRAHKLKKVTKNSEKFHTHSFNPISPMYKIPGSKF